MNGLGKMFLWLRVMKRLILLTCCAFLFAACGPNEGVLKSGRGNAETGNSTPVVATLEKDIEDVRNANCRFTYVLRRKDGAPIDADDRAFIRLPTADAKRRMISDNGHAILICSDFQIPTDKIRSVYDRFAVEDLSTGKLISESAK